MRLYTCTDHDVHWPVGGASIVIAPNEEMAYELLDKALQEKGLKGRADDPYTLLEIDIARQQAIVLRDGDY